MSAPSSLQASAQAFNRMREILFRPFNLNRWFSIGFCAWLASLGSGGGGSGGNGTSGRTSGNSPFSMPSRADIVTWISDNLLIVALIAGILIVVIVVSIVLCWLRSRGDFMLLHRLYNPDETVGVCWRRFKQPAWSLFLWRMGFFVVACLIWLLFAVIAYRTFFVYLMAAGFTWDISFLPALIGLLTGLVLIATTLFTVLILLWYLVVPVMYWRGMTATQAWGTVLTLCNQHPFAVMGFLLLMSVWWVVTAVAVLLLILCTCCLAAIPLIIPYLNAVVLLPMYLFFRAYPVYFLNQWRPDLFPAPGEQGLKALS